MRRIVLFFSLIHCVFAHNNEICSANISTKNSCTTQILGQEITDKSICQVEVLSKLQCNDLKFDHQHWNEKLGGVTLKPYILERPNYNYTMLNITFSNIKWKRMKLRVYDTTVIDRDKHCRIINLSNNLLFHDESILYYDCYWSEIKPYREKDSQKHILEFEVSNDENTNTGLMYFNFPTNTFLDPSVVAKENWRPFIYVEKFPSLMRLHILSPPKNIKISGYEIQVAIGCKAPEFVKTFNCTLRNNSEEEVFEYKGLSDVSYCFSVTPVHLTDGTVYKTVMSPLIPADPTQASPTICIVSFAAILFSVAFMCYFATVALRGYTKKWHEKLLSKNVILLPIISPGSHKIGKSFLNYLESEMSGKCNFDLLDEDDIFKTEHKDPQVWADTVFAKVTHILYIARPVKGGNYEPPPIYKNLDNIFKDLINVSFKKPYGPPDDPRPARPAIACVYFDYSDKSDYFYSQHYKKIDFRNDLSEILSFLGVDKNTRKDTPEYKKLMKDLEEVRIGLESSYNV